MAASKSAKNPDSTRGPKSKAQVAAKRKGRSPARRKSDSDSDSDLHYVLMSKDGTLTVVSRTTGESKTIDPKSGEFSAFADIVANRQKLGKALGQMLVERGFNGGNFENCLFIESYK